jgi:tetratricopeptide (TPR) repeat protein
VSSVRVLAAMAVIWIAPAIVCAQEDHSTPPEALEYFNSARAHYREGRYPEAATDLERAVTLDPASTTLHYNLARVYELMGRLPEALASYQRYYGLLPMTDSEERARTEAVIQRLEGAIASDGPREEVEAEPFRELEGTVLVRERGVADVPFFVALGGGAALLVASAITGGIALERASARDNLTLTEPGGLPAYQDEYASLDATANALGITTDVFLGVGGAALIAAVLLFVLRENEVEREIQPGVAIGASAAVVELRGTLW